MHLKLSSLVSLSLASLGLALPNIAMTNQTLGHAAVVNNCAQPVYVWSVASSVSPEIIVQPHENYTEVFRHDGLTGGVGLKVTAIKNGLYFSSPQTVFAYNLVDRSVWYDLSDVFGDPFHGSKVSLLPSEPAITWEDGIPPAGSQVRIQDASKDLVLTLC
ncbi:Bys1 family protein [Aspergillus affinis]|uniref:Bys1 family protein n=1 Tax=Aspergillus affinis TaxID=1070780 RepID=UPI0022FE4789|nr:uncharacterized protein KD926_004151 [Aspergillus affinis]KAI9046313.1 hypothetical protein KD926_004151 [Aspergillus affinis]